MQDVSVSVDQETSLNVKLQLGELSETVEVSAGTPLLKTERSDVAITFSEKTVASLPILNRRFTAFELLTPGVQATTSQTAASEDPQGSYRKVVNGQSFAGSSHLLDGTDNHDALLGPDRDQSDARVHHRGEGHDRQLRRRVRRDRRRRQRADEVRHQRPSAARCLTSSATTSSTRATRSRNSRRSAARIASFRSRSGTSSAPRWAVRWR